ncbi:MAG: hypothetical protein F4Z53_00530 [Acidimicrobiales bacterium]|nr:hypothetical protein [Acidimicrobiales bacterium]MYD32987.1 hypothetical protein [Acidimicrobiales bacterium]MYI08540.1 hypothetical protein [Acidimicrobiales bacterium]
MNPEAETRRGPPGGPSRDDPPRPQRRSDADAAAPPAPSSPSPAPPPAAPPPPMPPAAPPTPQRRDGGQSDLAADFVAALSTPSGGTPAPAQHDEVPTAPAHPPAPTPTPAPEPPTQSAPPAAAAPREVFTPQAQRGRRRPNLAILGVVLMAAAAFGFWFLLRSVDSRQQLVVAARTIERWEVVTPADFTTVEAHVGGAAAMTPDQVNLLVGLWAAGRVPQGTFVTPSMFSAPPLSSGDESGQVLVQVPLPASEAAFGTLESGDRIALIGDEGGDLLGDGRSLIGILVLDLYRDGSVFYVTEPAKAVQIRALIDRYQAAADREIWKIGAEVTSEDIAAALEGSGAPGVAPDSGNAALPGR